MSGRTQRTEFGFAQRRVRRRGWLCVLLALVVNVALFVALSAVNRTFQVTDPPDLSAPIEVFAPPVENRRVKPTRTARRASQPEQQTVRRLETMEVIPTQSHLVPRLPDPVPTAPDLAIAPVLSDLEPKAVSLAPIDEADVDTPPSKTYGPSTPYPRWALRTGKEADVTVGFVVDAKGNVTGAHVISCSGDSRFGQVVLEAMKKWRFTPGVYAGRIVPVRCRQTIHFELEDRP